MKLVVPAPEVVTLPITGEDAAFPVNRVFCVGRNYAAHAREMGHDPDREPPFFFMKPATSIVPGGGRFPYPGGTSDVHHEMELVVALGKGGVDIPESDALDHVWGYAVGIDMTRRDLQGQAKDMGRPWEIGKAFDHAAPCSAVQPASRIGHPQRGRIWLAVNGTTRQDGDLAQMIWKVPETIAFLSTLFSLRTGDLIMTGTPAGVAAIERGDRLEGGVDGVGEIVVDVV